MTWRDTGKWVLHLAPLIWWGGLASYVRVRSATPGNPPVGDLAATVPFMAIGLVALAAIVWLRKSDLKLLTTVFVAMATITLAVFVTDWDGWSFYLPVGLSAVVLQYLVYRPYLGGTRKRQQ